MLRSLGIEKFLYFPQPALPTCRGEEKRYVNSQGEFDFDAGATESGYTKWLAGRRVTLQELARRINLPLGRQVEVWLYGGVRLRGKLRLQEEILFIEEERVRHLPLVVDKVPFTYRDMESCIRLD